MHDVDIQKTLEQLLTKARGSWSLADGFAVVVDTRLRGKAAGKAQRVRRGHYRISLNPELLAKHPSQVTDVLCHEMAHCIVFHLWPAEPPHGKTWKTVCQHLGGSAATTHQLALRPARRSRRFRYLTDCGIECWLGPIQHRRAMAGGTYKHRRSGKPLFYSGDCRWTD